MAYNYTKLNPENAFIWRIVHRDNLPWILSNGLYCRNSPEFDPNFVSIGHADLINRRASRRVEVAPGGTLSDYVPFYFTPFSPMMYNIFTGRSGVNKREKEDICILVSSLHKVNKLGVPFVFSDRHAYTSLAKFSNNLSDLHRIDWPLLRARNFQRNPDDPEQIERYQAEALIYQHLPVTGLLGVICYKDTVKAWLDKHVTKSGIALDVRVLPKWYF
ncbi:DUF4433 domain-containing protein [Methylophilus sp. VKM B-3414]|uniref:type II toxin-antitoxin system toxin DNA ADP-ribosyl transferase DarT n=1 Tax=Methylophilus sp. VKM B-3414 TaxID=3076121 RepID=UPI0028C95462|nr:DUF4433 domain-containing protein [Methylophilus sp. VKM B-3414]MDT7849545.1 DUF4433 domain-containing protein [Methylophilus sp. VKM B-3414]